MPSKKQLYIHIGTVKTGTSALQRFLLLNRHTLSQKGVSYPEDRGGHVAHHRVSWSFRFREGVTKWNWPKDMYLPKQEWQMILEQIDGKKGIISSEHLIRNPIANVYEIFHLTSNYDVKIIVYWRRRDSLEDSWYNELIKGGERVTPPSYMQQLTSKEHLDAWAKVFGKENILVRPYERTQLYKEDVVADFLHHVLGLELTEEFTLPEKEVNTRLHRIALEYKRMVNLIPIAPREKRKIVNPLRDVSTVLMELGRKTYPVFSPQQRRELIKRYSKENAAIAREYLSRDDDSLFYGPLPSLNEDWQPYVELLEEDARFINKHLFRNNPEALNVITQGILCSQYRQKVEAREAALKLLPGIPSEFFREILSENLRTGNAHESSVRIVQDACSEIYSSKTWRAGLAIKRVYNKIPRILKKPALSAARKLYYLTKQS
ncbi:MAG: hypothetical protein ACYTEE_10625 [Planctomycetota bacterium]|jgi:hypothetical protein